MKPPPIQLAFAYGAAILQMVVVFHTSLGISDTLSDVLQVIALGGWAGFFIIHYRRRKSAASAGKPVSVATPAQQRRNTWLFVMIVVLCTLSSPLWTPYTGVVLPFPQMVAVSVVSCLSCLAVYFIARRLMGPKT
jgi:cobalamin synthase